MPHYDYVCDACDHQFEVFQRITAKPLRKCPECGRLKLRRLIGPGAAIVFKGSGFYKTDYRSESYKKAAAADGNGTAASKASTGKAADGKTGDGKTGDGKAKTPSAGKGEAKTTAT